MNTEPIKPVSPLEVRVHALRRQSRRWSLVAFPLMLAAVVCICGQVGLWFVRPDALPVQIDADSTADYGPWERLILAQFDPRLQTQVALDVTRGINPTEAMTVIAAAATATAMAPTYTSSVTPSATSTITLSPAPSITSTLTVTPSPSATATTPASATPSASTTTTSTVTSTPSATATATLTLTATTTASATPTPTVTPSRTPTRTAPTATSLRTPTPIVVAVVPTATPTPFVPPPVQVDIYADIRLINTTPGTQLQFGAICGNFSTQTASGVGMTVSMNGVITPIPSLGDLLGGGIIEVPYISPSPVQNLTVDVVVFCAASQSDPNPGNNTRSLRIVVAPLVIPPTPTPLVPTATFSMLPTNTPIVPPTDTPAVPATATPIIPPTDTPVLLPTNTPLVPPTDTPTATATPVVPPTDTPTATATPYVPLSVTGLCSTAGGFSNYYTVTNPNSYLVSITVSYTDGDSTNHNDPYDVPSSTSLIFFAANVPSQSVTVSIPGTGSFEVFANATNCLALTPTPTQSPTSTTTPTPTATPIAMTNDIIRELWFGTGDIGGVAVDELLADPRYPNAPNACFVEPEFDAPFNQGDDYGQRMRALLVPPATGQYTFWITSDNESRLSLSTDENPANAVQIAGVDPFVVTWYSYDEYASQQSAPVTLQAGQAYYIQALHTEGTITDFLRVAWQGPAIPVRVTIDGAYLTTAGMSCTPVANTPTPTSTPIAAPTDTPTATPTSTPVIPPTDTPTATPIAATGAIIREVWLGINTAGTDLNALLTDPRYPAAPNLCFTETAFDAPLNQGDNYGQRMRALLVPPASGDYTFWITSDNASRLSLSTDANPANASAIASSGPNNQPYFNFDEFPSQQSALVPLDAGRPYFIEAVHLEGVGGDFLRVAWQGPTIPVRTTIDGAYLSTTGLSCTPVPNTPTPTPTDTPVAVPTDTPTATQPPTSTPTPTATPGSSLVSMCVQTSTTATSGTLYDSGGAAANYSDNENCSMLIQPTGGGTIRLDVTQFSVENGYDFLTIYDGSSASGVLLGTYSGGTLPPTLWAASGSIYLVFQSDSGVTAAGFAANWTTSPQGNEYVMCNSLTTSTVSSGTLYDSGGSGFPYENNENCTFLIQPAGGGTIRLDFTQFNIEFNFDALRVYDGNSASGVLLGTYTGGALPPTLWAPSGSMYLVFQSDNAVTAPGFVATWTTTPQGNEYVMCNSLTTSTLSSGTLYDSGGPTFNYEDNENCSFLIQPSGGGIIQLDFSQFSTETNFDFVTVYDGANASGTLLGGYFGSAVPGTLWAASGSMYIVFTSDNANVQSGFTANWSILTPVAGFVRAINFGGPATVVDGNGWEGQTSPNYTLGPGDNSACFSGVFVPPTTRNRQEMMRCLIWDWTSETTITMTNIPNGAYDVYFWRWEDNFEQTLDHFLQGVLVADDLTLTVGQWRRMGPYTVAVNDGTILLNSVGGHQNIGGMEVWQVGTGGPGI